MDDAHFRDHVLACHDRRIGLLDRRKDKGHLLAGRADVRTDGSRDPDGAIRLQSCRTRAGLESSIRAWRSSIAGVNEEYPVGAQMLLVAWMG